MNKYRGIEMHSIRGNKAFRNFLLSYLSVLMIPVLIGTYAYYKTVQVIEEDAKKANMAVLDQSKETLDIRLQEVEQLATDLALNPKVIQFMNVKPPFTDREYYQIYEVFKDINKYRLNKFVSDYYLHFLGGQMLITPNTTYQLPNGYGRYFKYGQLDYEQWLERFEFDGWQTGYFRAEDIYYKERRRNMITYQHMIVSGDFKQPLGSVFVMFPEEEIAKLFEHLAIKNGGWACILDNRGDVIYGTTPKNILADQPDFAKIKGTGYFDYEVKDENMIVSYTTSTYNDWTYIAAIPSEAVLARADYIKRLTLTVMLLSIFLGLFFAMLMARRNSKPIQEIVDMVREMVSSKNMVKGNDYEYITGSVKELIHHHRDLKVELKHQLPFLQASFISRLFKGEFKDTHEMLTIASQTGISVSDNTFIVMILRFSGYKGLISKETLEEMNRKKILVERVLGSMEEIRTMLTHNITEDTLAILLSVHEEPTAVQSGSEQPFKNKLEKKTKQMLDVLYSETMINIHIGIGTIYRNPMEIWKSFNEAQRAIEYGCRAGKLMVWHWEVPLESNLYYFPVDTEMRMIQTVRSGNREGLEYLFADVEKENFQKRKLSDTVVRHLLFELNATMLKIFESLQDAKYSFEGWILHFDNRNPVMEDYHRLKETFLELCTTVEREKQDQNVLLKDRMLDYIESNYADSNIGLNLMASQFHLSESYLSTFFKELTGQNFSSYLESVRMKAACCLLAETRFSITEIANHVGYTSDKTFRRAFKRYYGILPTSYREAPLDINSQASK
jgi:two-component system, response regulator YesN